MSKVLIGTFVGVTLAFVYSIIGVVDGHLRPVLSDVEITQIDVRGPGWLGVYGEGRRNRICTFHHLEWRVDESDAKLAVELSPRDETTATAPTRREGRFKFGPIVLNASPGQLRNSYARVYHRCGPLWMTRSVFWIGPEV